MARERPNVVFIMADDHAAHAVGCYGSRINKTPHIDRIAAEGMRFTDCFCTNALCAPSRATILTGTHNHVNGVTTLETKFDARQPTFVSQLRAVGYQTAIVGKWHLGHGGIHDPHDFDYWNILPDQGDYYDPELIENGRRHMRRGYATNLITDIATDWLEARDRARPFCLLVHHKAPHRPWEPDPTDDTDDLAVPIPETFDDDYRNRARAAAEARMRVRRDLTAEDLKRPVPDGLTDDEEAAWKYQRYITDYLRCVSSLDDNVGRVLDHLATRGLSEDTVVVYTSDQGFFLGDHGWFDKRFMYEESLRMPLLVRYPREITGETVCDALVSNVDFAQTILDLAGVPDHSRMQGRSLRPLLGGHTPSAWRRSIYYRYWEHLDGSHNVCAHYGVRTQRHKLVYYYGAGLEQPGASRERRPPEWELFDLEADPAELNSVYNDPAYADVVAELIGELARIQADIGDQPYVNGM